MENLKINESLLRDKLQEALESVADHGWSGWGVALHLHRNGEITISDIISNNTWSESDDFEEILRVQTWNVDYSIEQWADEVRNNQYSENDKKILAEIEKLECNDEIELENLSDLAKKDYENCYQIQHDEDLTTAIDHYVMKLENDYNYGEFKYELI